MFVVMTGWLLIILGAFSVATNFWDAFRGPADWFDRETRSRKLLRDNLTTVQRQQWDENQSIPVIGEATGAHYTILPRLSLNIRVDEIGKSIDGLVVPMEQGHFCIGPAHVSLPIADVMLAQKIMLECDEVAALKMANWGFVSGGDRM